MANSCVSPSAVVDVANSVFFPEEIMLNIQTRLPVKSIARFKSVCKCWRNLFSSLEFLKLALHFSKNQSVIIYSFDTITMHVLNNIENNKQAMVVDHPCGPGSHGAHVIGSCNGLVCMAVPKHGCVLWNPATRLSVSLPLPGFIPYLKNNSASLGFGYDAERDDFKVVRISNGEAEAEAEVYSVGSNSWTRIKLGKKLINRKTRCDLIVNGNPYWFVSKALVYFEATKQVFKTVPVPSFLRDCAFEFVEINGVLGVLVWKHRIYDDEDNDNDIGTDNLHSPLGVWAFDESDQTWKKKHSLGPSVDEVTEYHVFLVRLKNRNVVWMRWVDGTLFVCDPHGQGGVDEIVINERPYNRSFQVHGYTDAH